MYKVSGELFSWGITDSGRVMSREGDIGIETILCKIITLERIFQICWNFYCWVSEITFHSLNHHCCLGKLPFKNGQCKVMWYRMKITCSQVTNQIMVDEDLHDRKWNSQATSRSRENGPPGHDCPYITPLIEFLPKEDRWKCNTFRGNLLKFTLLLDKVGNPILLFWAIFYPVPSP